MLVHVSCSSSSFLFFNKRFIKGRKGKGQLGFSNFCRLKLEVIKIYQLSLFTGKAKGVLYEDDGDGYEFMKGGFLLTHYVAELQSSIVTVEVSKTEGSWKRPQRRLHVQLLLGGGAMVWLIFFRDNNPVSETKPMLIKYHI